MLDNRSFLRHALIFGTASLFTQAAGVLLIPLFTRCLTKDEFGALEVLVRAGEVAGVFLLVSGLKQGLVTNYQQKDTDAERRRTVSATLLLVLGVSLLLGAVALMSASAVAERLRVETHTLILAVFAVILEPFHLLPLALMQARLESTRFVAVTVCHFLARVILSIVFVTRLHWGVAGVLGATAVTGALFAVALTGANCRRGLARPDWASVRGLLGFAVPFLPASICFFVLQNGDRFVLQRLHGNAEVATYSLGYKIAQAVGTFSLAPLYMVWGSHLYAVARTPDAPVVFGRAFTRILATFLFVALGVSVFDVEAVALLGGGAYESAVLVVAPVLLASFFQSAASLMDAAFYVRHRTGAKLLVTLAATILMAALYAWWIPAYAGMGAAYATLAGFAFLACCTLVVTQRLFPVVYEWRRVGAAVLLAGLFWLLSRPLAPVPWLMPAKVLLWLSWPVLLWHLGLVADDEKQYVLSFLRATAPAGGGDACGGTREIVTLGANQVRAGRVRGERRMDAGYVGKMLVRHAVGTTDGDADWRCVAGDNELSLRSRGGCARLFSWDSLALLIRGYARPAGTTAPLDLEALAQEVRCRYLETNELGLDGLDGSFTVALLDGQAQRVTLYRNVVGAGFTYYYVGRDGFRFGSNLAALVEASGVRPRENLLALPSYFLYRFVPGAETLFDGFFRLLPGEEVIWDGGTLTRRQRQTFADFVAPSRHRRPRRRGGGDDGPRAGRLCRASARHRESAFRRCR